VRFWIFTTSVSLSAQKADGILLCEFNSRNGYQHTLTVWETKEQMMAFRASPAHVRAMKRISQIGIGKVFGYEADFSPSWEDALSELDRNGSEF
jgi:heme-degrading monooxygenase HmoA